MFRRITRKCIYQQTVKEHIILLLKKYFHIFWDWNIIGVYGIRAVSILTTMSKADDPLISEEDPVGNQRLDAEDLEEEEEDVEE